MVLVDLWAGHQKRNEGKGTGIDKIFGSIAQPRCDEDFAGNRKGLDAHCGVSIVKDAVQRKPRWGVSGGVRNRIRGWREQADRGTESRARIVVSRVCDMVV